MRAAIRVDESRPSDIPIEPHSTGRPACGTQRDPVQPWPLSCLQRMADAHDGTTPHRDRGCRPRPARATLRGCHGDPGDQPSQGPPVLDRTRTGKHSGSRFCSRYRHQRLTAPRPVRLDSTQKAKRRSGCRRGTRFSISSACAGSRGTSAFRQFVRRSSGMWGQCRSDRRRLAMSTYVDLEWASSILVLKVTFS